MAKKIVLIVLVIGLAAAIAFYYKGGFEEGAGPGATSTVAGADDQSGNSGTAAPAESPGGDPETNRTTSGSRSSASQNRAAYTALAQKLTAAENTLKRDEFIDKSQQNLDLVNQEVNDALRGNDQAAKKLFTRERECRSFNPMTPLDVETEIAYYQSRFDRRRNISDEQRAQQDKRIEQTRNAMTSRVESCSWRHTDEFPSVRSQVERQAETGDVLARFYYAMLFKPSPYEVDYLLETAAWSDNSLRYTMDNINQGMTLGYLALSLSHAMGVFTHQDSRLAGIWGYLVMTCPMRGPIAEPYLNSLLSNERMEFLSGTTVDIGQVWAMQVCP